MYYLRMLFVVLIAGRQREFGLDAIIQIEFTPHEAVVDSPQFTATRLGLTESGNQGDC